MMQTRDNGGFMRWVAVEMREVGTFRTSFGGRDKGFADGLDVGIGPYAPRSLLINGRAGPWTQG